VLCLFTGGTDLSEPDLTGSKAGQVCRRMCISYLRAPYKALISWVDVGLPLSCCSDQTSPAGKQNIGPNNDSSPLSRASSSASPEPAAEDRPVWEADSVSEDQYTGLTPEEQVCTSSLVLDFGIQACMPTDPYGKHILLPHDCWNHTDHCILAQHIRFQSQSRI